MQKSKIPKTATSSGRTPIKSKQAYHKTHSKSLSKSGTSKKMQRRNTREGIHREAVEMPPSDIEQMLIERISRDKSWRNVPRKALFIPEIIYASSANLRELAFSNGISAGRMIYERSDKTMGALLAVLEQAGLGKVLYHLFENTAVITAKPNITEPNIKTCVHTYEAGIMAGFLGASAKHSINVSETHCVYNGNQMCQFKISEFTYYPEDNRNLDSREILDSILGGIRNTNHNGYVSEEYLQLYLLPLMVPPISEGISQLMYLAGKSISSKSAWLNEEGMKLVKESFGLKSVKLIRHPRNKKLISIVVEYGTLGSSSQFLSLSQSFFHGLIDGTKNTQATSHVELGSGNNYILYIQLNQVK